GRRDDVLPRAWDSDRDTAAVTIWDWVNEYGKRAQTAGDRERMRLHQILSETWPLRRTAPDVALALYDQGHRLAERLGEPWQVMLFDHGRLQALSGIARDYAAALELAVRCAVEARKPVYAQLPQRVCLHEDLIDSYVATDPMGYAPRIEEALEYMAREVRPE